MTQGPIIVRARAPGRARTTTRPPGRPRRRLATAPLALAAALVLAPCGAGTAVAQDTAPKANAQINGALDAFFAEGGTPAKADAMAASVDPAIYDFAHDPATSDEVHETFMEALAADARPDRREALRQFFDAFTIEQQRKLMREGFESGDWSATNLADIVAGTVLSCYAIIDATETTATQDEPVRSLFRAALDVPAVTAMTSHDKQVMAETLLLSSVALVVQYQQAQDGQGDLGAVQDAARQLLQGFGLDPAFFRLGPDGLEATPEMAKVASGELTMEQAFPEITAKLAAIGATPAGDPGDPGAAGASATGTAATAAGTATAPAATATPLPTLQAPAATSSTPGTDAVDPLGAPSAGAPVNPLGATTAAPSTYAGTFAGDGLGLVLRGDATALSGEIVRGRERYPATAVEADGALTGRFVAAGSPFDFTARADGDAVVLETGGNRFRLERSD